MNIRHLTASTVSLFLIACSATAPIRQAEHVLPAQTLRAPVAPLPKFASALSPDLLQARITHDKGQERIEVKLTLPKGFATQYADAARLAFIQVEVLGQGLSGTISHDGDDFIPVVAGSASATISNLPILAGGHRVVIARGFDAAFAPLAAFEARGNYVSDLAVPTVNLSLGRRWLLLGQLIETLLTSDQELLDLLDLAALQSALEAAMGFNPALNRFERQPSQYDPVALASALPSDGSTPSASEINAAALGTLGTASVTLNTPNGLLLGEDLVLIVTDPSSQPAGIGRGNASGNSYDLPGISPGTWVLEVRTVGGTLLASTPVTVDSDGTATLDSPSLPLTGVIEAADVTLPLLTPNGGDTLEDVVLSVSDPRVPGVTFASGSSSGGSVVLPAVTVGTQWTIQALGSNGRLLNATTVTVDSGGTASLGANPLLLTCVREPGEFCVNSFLTGFQLRPAMAMDSDGDFVVTWMSSGQDGSSEGVFAQRFSSVGLPLGSEFQVNTYTTNFQNFPVVAMDSDGDFVIAWQNFTGPDESLNGIFGQRYTSAGLPLGSEFRVSTYTTGFQNLPAVGMDNDGDFVITWQSNGQDGSLYGVFGRRYDSAGIAQSATEFQVNVYTMGPQAESSVAMDSNGDFVVTWQGFYQDGSLYGIFGRRYDSMGAAGSEFQVNTFATHLQYNPDVGMDSDGDFVVTWTSYGQDGSRNGIFGRRYDSAGTARDATEFRVNTYTTSDQLNPAVAMDGDGHFTITWQDRYQDGSNYGVYAQRYSSTGALRGSEFQVNAYTTSPQRFPVVALDSDGDFVITWESVGQDGSNYGVIAKRYDSAGTVQ
ncbi:MAG: hypothetical protein ACAI44_24745 [Candidatus Sericytochromatia bacterium]